MSDKLSRDWESDTALSDQRLRATAMVAKRRFAEALEAEGLDLSLQFEADVTPSGRPRRQKRRVNYCDADEQDGKMSRWSFFSPKC